MSQSLIPVTDHDPREVINVWLNTKNAPRTRTEYRKIVTEALEYIGGLDKVSGASLARYHRHLMDALAEEALSSATVSLRLTALSDFLSFIGVPDKVLSAALDRPTVTVQTPYRDLSGDEVLRLVNACSNLRDRTLITLLYETGARCEELINVKLSDIRYEANIGGRYVLRIRKGKGGKARDVPLSKAAVEAVSNLIEADELTIGDDVYLIRGWAGKKLTTARVRQILIAARRASGVAGASSHALRHSAAMRLIRRSGDINIVRLYMGHANLETTKRYTSHVKLEELAAVID